MTKNNEFGKFIGKICYKVKYIILKAQILYLSYKIRKENKLFWMVLIKHMVLEKYSELIRK